MGTSVLMVARNLEKTFCFQRTFQLVGACQQVFNAAKLGDEFLRRLFAYTGAAGNVVRRVAHQSQHVDDL